MFNTLNFQKEQLLTKKATCNPGNKVNYVYLLKYLHVSNYANEKQNKKHIQDFICISSKSQILALSMVN